MDWNQCIVIDCLLSLPSGHKPFTRPHCVRTYHVTYQLRLLLNAFFCSSRCVRSYDIAEFCRRLFSVFLNSGYAASVSVNLQINRPFSVIGLCFCRGKNKSSLVSGGGNRYRCAWLNVTPNSRAINCTESPLNPCLLRVSSSRKPEWRFRPLLRQSESDSLIELMFADRHMSTQESLSSSSTKRVQCRN